jgi:hypothetical protein
VGDGENYLLVRVNIEERKGEGEGGILKKTEVEGEGYTEENRRTQT